MNKIKSFLTVSLVAGAILSSVNSVSAAVRCETQYGGNQVCVTTGELQIDKEILDPRDSSYKDNLYVTDYRFQTADFVTFRLTIKNVGDDTLRDIEVVDTLPSFLFYTGGSVSGYTKDALNPGDTWTIEVKTQIVSESQLVVDRICGVNTAEVWADGDQHDKDTAELCAAKKVLGVKVLPETGDNTPFIIFGASVATALFGLALIRLGEKNSVKRKIKSEEL